MNIFEFLSELQSRDIHIWIDDVNKADVQEVTLHCNAPEGTLTPQIKTELSQRKAEIIAFLKTANLTNHNQIPSLIPILTDSNPPLSLAQQRLWFFDQLVPNNPFYNIPAVMRLTGSLNLRALEQTFNEIVRRHQALRTNFVTVEGEPIQKIAPTLTLSLPLIDLRNSPQPEREIAAKKITVQEAQKPFNLATDSLIKVTLLQLDQQEYFLIINLHHIVSDGWSIGVLIREIEALYTAFVKNKPSPLPELPIQYTDFAYWQRQWLEQVGQNGYSPLQIQLAYWRQQLDGISALNLPLDRSLTAVQTYRGGRERLQISRNLSQQLEALSQQEGVTLFMTLLAAFKTLLYHYTHQEDITVGSPIANRNRSEIEGLIGFFVNSLVMRTNLSGNPTFRELLGRVKEVALGAYAHQDLPFEKLVEELEPERILDQNPLFQVAFALQNSPTKTIELPGLTLHPEQLDTQTTRFDLEFHLWEPGSGNDLWVDTSEGISGLVVYRTDLFEAATITRLLKHFQTLLENIVAHPERRIQDLDILTAVEQHQLLVEWNHNFREYPQNQCIHQLFEAQVEQTPNAIALSFEDVETRQIISLSYQELNIRSNQLAHYLKTLGVGAETLVGICLDRSLEMIIGMLGILKMGGAYVPLDPNYPQERLNWMLEDTQASILLTQQRWIPRLKTAKSRVICLEKDWEAISKESKTNPNSSITVNNRAYVIYTSGSTGTPKGVEIEHGGLLNLVFWHQKAFEISPGDRVTQVSSVAFDAYGWEIWPYLAAGASIYIPDEETRRSPEKLQDYLISKEITVSFIPTVFVEKFVSLNWQQNICLRLVLTGGDKLNQCSVPSLPFKIVNNYGPTENTVVTTSGEIPVKEKPDTLPTIGRPIANTQVYVLDQNLKPVSVGVPGELYISGKGLARGYLNRPDLTAEKFIPNPFKSLTDNTSKSLNSKLERLYKTGDLVRYLAGGNLEFLGRIDDQIKLRGYRIELGEIEALLSQHPAVRQAVVIPREVESRLVAYVVLNFESNALVPSTQPIQLQDEHVSQWQMLYDETYNQPAANIDETFNIVGWNSSYNNQPITDEQMREWVNNQVAQILAFQPNKVLEIGCGTGLLLFRIAPQCTEYYATDFSLPSLNYIRQQLVNKDLHQIKLLEKVATDFEGLATKAFDTVILNSVVQYFPSIEYFMQVLKGAINCTAPGGILFIGDVRSLPLLEAFHAAVQLSQAEPSVTREQLQQRVQLQIFQETELVIDPAFFKALKQQFSQVTQVQIQLIRGCHHNELTQFRYNVILHIEKPPQLHKPVKWMNWSEATLTVAKVRQILVENQPEILGITQIPNERVMAAVKTAEWLSRKEPFKTVGQIRKALSKLQNLGVDPENFWILGEEVGYHVDISWSDSGTEGYYDVIFAKSHLEQVDINPSNPGLQQPKAWHSYANNPLQAKAAQNLIPQLQTYLKAKLPDYMVPSALVVLESLPLTPNGKIDRRALPAPDSIKPELASHYIAPKTPVEEALGKIFAEVLGVKQVGIQDNFFELGGHSLLATQLASRVRDAFGVELPLRSVFEAPAIAQLSKVIESLKNNKTQTKAPALVPISRESRRTKLSSLNKEIKDQ